MYTQLAALPPGVYEGDYIGCAGLAAENGAVAPTPETAAAVAEVTKPNIKPIILMGIGLLALVWLLRK